MGGRDVTAGPVRIGGRRRWVAETTPKTRRAGRNIPALDGIRAVAVLLVLAEHGGVPGVPGGFLGVDVFFVLSGFLITSLLLDELGRTGRISLRDFWVRRARRLLPALLIVVAAVLVARALFPPDSITGLRDDAVAAFLWMANWAFVAQGTDYFSQGSPPSPLQHMWSLGVEEQFYLVWPLLIVAVALLLLTARKAAPALAVVRWTVFGLALAGAAASATLALRWVSEENVNRVYFGTDTRVQALLIGAAAAALLVRDWSALTSGVTVLRNRWIRWAARLASVAGIAVLAFVAHRATGAVADFRAGLLIAVAVGAVLVVVPVALDQRGPVARVLALPPLVWLGAISYGVYLWHWPVFLVLNGERTGWTGWPLFAVRCAVTLAFAALSWWAIEQPVQRWRPSSVPMLRLATATAATAAVLTATFVRVDIAAPLDDPLDISSAAMVMPEVPVLVGSGVDDSATPTVAVFGDSVAWTLMRYFPPTPELHLADYTTIGCGIARGGPYRMTGQELTQKPECDTWPSRWAQRIEHSRPDTVLLMIGRWEIVDRMHDGDWANVGEDAYDEYLRGELNRALDIVSATGANVVVTTAPYSRRAERSDGSLYPEDRPARTDAWNALVREVAAERPNVTVLDLNKKMGPGGYYQNRVDGIRLRGDGLHPTPEAVEWLAPWLISALEDSALQDRAPKKSSPSTTPPGR
jgi:peptidoglycan/LPS O-acetylase OafA/YrhL